MSAYDKMLSDAEKELAKYEERENWSEANQRQGFRDGIISYKRDLEYDEKWKSSTVLHYTQSAEFELALCTTEKEYGDAAYWRSFINGRMSAESACRLDFLEAKLA